MVKDSVVYQYPNDLGLVVGLPTAADENPGNFFESFEIPGVSRFLS